MQRTIASLVLLSVAGLSSFGFAQEKATYHAHATTQLSAVGEPDSPSKARAVTFRPASATGQVKVRPAVYQQPVAPPAALPPTALPPTAVPQGGSTVAVPPVVQIPTLPPTSGSTVGSAVIGGDGCAAQAPPTLAPTQLAPTTTTITQVPVTTNTYLRPVVTYRPVPNGTYVSRGLVGQPKAYVEGQPVRNFFRYIFP